MQHAELGQQIHCLLSDVLQTFKFGDTVYTISTMVST
jgi:hypothetical protein